MKKIRLSEINADKIKNREFERALPELYELENVIENNCSHINDPTLTHVISVREKLEILLENVNRKTKNRLNKKTGSYSRKELLLFAAIFHDIAKKETTKKKGNETIFPGHEKASAEKMKGILKRFDLSKSEEEIVLRIIENHGFFYNLTNQAENCIKKKISGFKKNQSDIFVEVVLLAKADLLGSQLIKKDPEGFRRRSDFLDNIINNY